MANEFMGWEQYLVLRKESTFGTFNSGGTDIFFPFSEYSVVPTVQSTQAELFLGIRQRKHNRIIGANLAGNLSLPLLGYHVSSKSIAEHLISWATSSPASSSLESWSARLKDPVGDIRQLGLRVSTMTIDGDADRGTVNIALGLIGSSDAAEGSMPSLASTNPQPIECAFSDVHLYLSSESQGESATAAAEEVSIRKFSLALNNNLKAYRTNSFFPTVIPAGVRSVDLSFDLFKNANTYDVLKRSTSVTNRAAHISMSIPHLGTGASGTNTVIDFYFDKLNFQNVTDSRSLNELFSQSVSWISLKPSTSDNEMAVAFSLA